MNVKWHSDPLPVIVLPNGSDFPPISWPWYRAWPSPNYKVVSMTHLQRVWHDSRERLPFRKPGSVPLFELACAPIVETKFLELAMSLLDFLPWIPLGTFTISLLSCVANNTIKLSRHRLSFFEHEHFVFTYFLYFNISTCKVCKDMLKY